MLVGRLVVDASCCCDGGLRVVDWVESVDGPDG